MEAKKSTLNEIFYDKASFISALEYCSTVIELAASLPDIKPENLLISSEDVLKLCDFGELSFFVLIVLSMIYQTHVHIHCNTCEFSHYICHILCFPELSLL